MTGVPVVSVDGSTATATAPGLAYPFLDEPPAGGTTWLVGGTYYWKLAPTSGGWKISRLELRRARQEGNRNLPPLTMERASGGEWEQVGASESPA